MMEVPIVYDDSISAVESVVREAASHIGLLSHTSESNSNNNIVDRVCQNLTNELVMEHWQLTMLDSIQWKELEAPMGFVAAIQRQLSRIEEQEQQARDDDDETETTSDNSNNRTKRRSDLSRLYPSMLTSSSSSISERYIAPRKTSKPPAPPAAAALPDMEEGEGKVVVVETVQEEEESLDNKDDDFVKCKPPRTIREIMGTYNHWGMSQFMFSPNFHRAILHSKSGGDLKAYNLFVMELNVVVSALLCGAAVEMWGVFPQDTEEVPMIMTMLFHSLSCVTVLLQLLSTFSWVGCLFVVAAVSPDKFATFRHQVEHALEHFLILSELATLTFVVNIGLLFSSFVWCNTSEFMVHMFVGVLLPAMIVFPLLYVVHHLLDYIARTAFHGLLLTNGTTTTKSTTIPGRSFQAADADDAGVFAQQAEESLCRSFHDHSVPNEAFVLDAYAEESKCTSQQPQQTTSHGNRGSRITSISSDLQHSTQNNAPDYYRMTPAFRATMRQMAMQPT
jgi:hypothetical protein